MESINEKIKRLRIESGVSKAEMARAAGLKQSSYSSIENGDTKSITIDVGKGFAKALNIPFTELFDIELSNGNAEIIEKLGAEVERLNNQLNDKTMVIELQQREKEIYKQNVIRLIVRYSEHIIYNLSMDLNKASNEKEINMLEMQKSHEIKNRQKMFEDLILIGFITQSDIDSHYKEMADSGLIFNK
jgi:transcriptional regulator with XRE-family HTH domain